MIATRLLGEYNFQFVLGPMNISDKFCSVIASWDRFEKRSTGTPLVEHWLHKPQVVDKISSRMEAIQALSRLKKSTRVPQHLDYKITALQTYARTLLGEHLDLERYIERTLHIPVRRAGTKIINSALDTCAKLGSNLGIKIDEKTVQTLRRIDRPIKAKDLEQLFLRYSKERLQNLTAILGSNLSFRLRVRAKKSPEWWWFVIHGDGASFDVTVNVANFPLFVTPLVNMVHHEVIGHAAQLCSFRKAIRQEHVPTYFSPIVVFGPDVWLSEGLAQSIQDFVPEPNPDIRPLLDLQVALHHFSELVFNNAHIQLNDGREYEDICKYVRGQIPWLTQEEVGRNIASRANDPIWRSYQYSYPSGIDYFRRLAIRLSPIEKREFIKRVYSKPQYYHDICEAYGRPGSWK